MPPTGAESKVKDPEYINWLKVSLALYYLKDGLHSFIQGEVDAMHQFLLQKLYGGSVVPKPKCSSCKSKDVKQNRNTYIWKFRSPCLSCLCDVWLTELMTLHNNPTSNKIYWENCDVTAWPFVPWEWAKLYMPRGQPPTNIGPPQSDAQALLTLMATCTYFHRKLSLAGLTLTHTVSTIRNRVMHSGDMRLRDGDRKSFIQDIIHLLEDQTCLGSLEKCKQAVDEINRINNDSLDVSFNIDLERKALSECVNDCRQELGVHKEETEETVDSLKEELINLKVQYDNLGTKYQKVDARIAKLSRNVSLGLKTQSAWCSAIKKDVYSLKRKTVTNQSQQKRKLRKLDKAIQEVKASTSRATDEVSAKNMESDISKLRDDLIKAYRNLRCVQVSAIFEKRRCNIDDIDVDLVIEEKQGSRNTEDKSKYVSMQYKDAQSHSNQTIKVTSYKQIFQDETNSKFKRVYLHGKGGLGKTTFCRKVLHAWCNAHEGRAVTQDGSFQDETVLKMFDLLFYMNLREVSSEENLIEVIYTQFPLEEVPSKNILGTLLKYNGDKVLFILDGLDEMIVNAGFIENVVTRSVYPNCCFLVSSRPWKISQMELHEGTEIDLLLDLQGFSKTNAINYAKKIFENCYNDGIVIEQFKKDIESSKLARQLIHVPLLLLFLAQVWYENKMSLPSKLHELYILLLNLLADRMKEKYKKDSNHRQTRFTLDYTQFPFPRKISETSLVVNFGEGFMLSLCEVAHHFLLSSEKENSLVFEETKLLKALADRGKEKLDVALELGILSVTDSVSYLNRKTNVSFLHKTMQEFFTALCLILSPDKLTNFIFSIADLNIVQQNENIIVFLFGLMPELGNRVLGKVNELCRDEVLSSQEELAMNISRLYNISTIYLRCKEEVIRDNVLLNVSCLCLQPNNFDLHPWNPAFLRSLYLIGSPYERDYVLVDLRCLRGLIHIKLNDLNCELYLPESGSLFVLLMERVTLSSSCCDVLGSTLAYCTKLQTLVIRSTDLHNCLLDLSNMTELTDLEMSEVTLSSSCCDVLGSTLTHCTKLQTLHIHKTDLYNCLLDLSNLTELRVLHVSEVTLSSSCCDVLGSTLTHCTKLQTLHIRKTDHHKHLLDLSNLTELTELEMSEVTLSSSCCDVLGSTLTHCTKLQTLHIHKTDLYNCLLDLSNLTELTDLKMSEVTLSSSCCDVLGSTLTHCSKLKTLNICKTDLQNCLLDLSNLTELTDLEMSEVTLSSSCCDVLGSTLTHCTKLQTLHIHKTDQHNCLLYLSNLTELRVLHVSEVTLSSSCCDVLGSTLTHCTKLQTLHIGKTDQHKHLLDLSNMTELTELEMSEVTLSSSCCDVLGSTLTHCTKLQTCLIYKTELHNCLLDLSNLTELIALFVSEVTLSISCCDVLGSTLTHCIKLTRLKIHKTDLHNCLLDLSNMTKLIILDLSEVTLSSSCCDVLGSTLTHCTKLLRLKIHKTDLHNCLLDLSNMTKLIILDLLEVTLSSSCCDVLGSSLRQCNNLMVIRICNTDLHNCVLETSNMTILHQLLLDGITLSSSACQVLELSDVQTVFCKYTIEKSPCDNDRWKVKTKSITL